MAYTRLLTKETATLADIIEGAFADLVAAGFDADRLLFGDRFLSEDGAPNRIVVVDKGATPTMGPIRLGAGQIARMLHICEARIWGDPGDDQDQFARYHDAVAMGDDLIAAIRKQAEGRVELQSMPRTDDTEIVTYGEEYRLTMAILRPVEVPTGTPIGPNLRPLVTARPNP